MWIKEQSEFQTVIESLKNQQSISIDIETTAKPAFINYAEAGLDPYRGDIRTIQIATKENSYLIDLKYITDISPLNSIFDNDQIIKIGHNLKFDIKFLMINNVKVCRIIDTMLFEQIINNGKLGFPNSLKEVAKRRLGIDLDKTEQTLFTWAELTETQVTYALKDVEILNDIFLSQKKQALAMDRKYKTNLITPNKYSNYSISKLEFEFAIELAQIELNGIKLDQEKWLLLDQKNKIEFDKYSSILIDLLEPAVKLAWERQLAAADFKKVKKNQMSFLTEDHLFDRVKKTSIWKFDNLLNSPKQLLAALKIRGINLSDTNKITLLDSMKNFRNDPEKLHIIQTMLNYREYSKALSSFGATYLKYVNPVTNRIHPDYIPIVRSGRSTVARPNYQQVPHANEYRECFVPELGSVYIICDYSAIEMRAVAALAGDTKFVSYFVKDDDVHLRTASFIFDLSYEDFMSIIKDNTHPEYKLRKAQRNIAKTVAFGSAYGAGPGRIQNIMSEALNRDVTLDEAKEVQAKFFDYYPGIKSWLDKVGLEGFENKYSIPRSGRIRFLEESSVGKTKYQLKASYERQAKNNLVQGIAGEFLKFATIFIANDLRKIGLYDTIKIIGLIHDEIQIEIPIKYLDIIAPKDQDGKRYSELIQGNMQRAAEMFLPECPVKVSIGIGDSWAEK